jgi:hypothetical protein
VLGSFVMFSESAESVAELRDNGDMKVYS